ncbi:MAG: undecaprenyl-diphosphate phosphatase [Dethiosulfatibacter sp.]|nr:undecaprenyl-diphosphate phosphatase [Dethiosulfatibacter sp.]
MPLILKALILGIVEGITEFLPISSTGHMIIVGHFLNFKGDFALLFEIVIQLGAILAIIVLYRNKIYDSFKNLLPGYYGFKLWSNIIISFIPFGIIAFIFHDKVEEILMKPLPVSIALLVGGIWMIYAEKKYKKNCKTVRMEDINYKQAFIIGLFQCLAVLFPGFSRSAATIIGGWIVGLSTVAAAEFSFFLALPTMIIATGYSLLETELILSSTEIISLIVGFIVSFFIALILVEKFITYLKHKTMRGFAFYRIIIGVLILTMIQLNIFKMFS